MVTTRTLAPLLLAALAALAAAHPDYSDSWEEFKQSYGKQYDSAEEEVNLLELSTKFLFSTVIQFKDTVKILQNFVDGSKH